MSKEVGTRAVKSMERVEPHLDMRGLTEVLIRHYGFTEGHYDVTAQFSFATGRAGSSPEKTYPTAFVGASAVALVKFDEPTETSVDAALVSKAPRRKVSAKRKVSVKKTK